MVKLSAEAETWAADRGISRPTLDRLGVGSGTVNMPDLGRCEVIMFPYKRGPNTVNWKARNLARKKEDRRFRQMLDGESRFWNLDAVLSAGSETVYITEGEMDALALIEARARVFCFIRE